MAKLTTPLEVARAFVEAHADSVGAHGFLGTLYAEAGQLDAAVAAFQKVVEIKPGSVPDIAIWRWCLLGRAKFLRLFLH